MEKKENKKEKDKFFVGEIATETKPIIADRENEEQYTIELALAKIMNDIEELKKGLLG